MTLHLFGMGVRVASPASSLVEKLLDKSGLFRYIIGLLESALDCGSNRVFGLRGWQRREMVHPPRFSS
jgi:hypothetical protein